MIKKAYKKISSLTKVKKILMKTTIIYYFLLTDLLKLKLTVVPPFGDTVAVLSQTTTVRSIIWHVLSGYTYQKLYIFFFSFKLITYKNVS